MPLHPPSGYVPPAAAPAARCWAHSTHHGPCPACQRAARQRQALQLAQANGARRAWQAAAVRAGRVPAG